MTTNTTASPKYHNACARRSSRAHPSSEIILWQDYDHDEKTIRFSDLLSLFVGESLGLRLPGVVNKKYPNLCPCFYSGRAPMQCQRRESGAAAKLSAMMDERFTTFRFFQPLPMAERDARWPQCGRCAAGFFLQGVPTAAQTPPGQPCLAPAPSLPISEQQPSFSSARAEGCVVALQALAVLHRQGDMTDAVFAAAKQRLLRE